MIESAIELAVIMSVLAAIWRDVRKNKKKIVGFVDIYAQSHKEFDILKFKKEYC